MLQALLDDRLDVVATDHAPHTWQEKQQSYLKAPSGLPLVQHSINVMLEFYHQQKISLEKIIEKMCHAPATCLKVEKRVFISAGFYGDLAVIVITGKWKVKKDNILYK